MTWIRYGLLAVALLVAGSLVASTGGVSSTALDRGIDVAVVSDDEAYLGVQRECSNSTLRVTITNQYASSTTLDVDVAVNGTTEAIDDLEAGESRTTTFEAYATDDTITIDASGSGVSVRLARSIPSGC